MSNHPVFEERFSHKETKRAEQKEYEKNQSADGSLEFDVVVKAANPKRKVTTFVSSESQ